MATSELLTSTTIGFASFTANLLSISHSQSRVSVQTSTCVTTGNHTFIPGDLVDSGSLDIEFDFDTSDDTGPPMGSAAETITLTFPDGTVTNTWQFSAFMTDYSITGSLEERITASATLKLSADITY